MFDIRATTLFLLLVFQQNILYYLFLNGFFLNFSEKKMRGKGSYAKYGKDKLQEAIEAVKNVMPLSHAATTSQNF